MFKKIILGSFIVVGLTVVIALAGIYKFGYLSSKNGYDVDGNKVPQQIKNIGNDKNKQAVGNNKNLEQRKPMFNAHYLISPAEFKKKLDSQEYILVDIRTDKENQNEKIPGTTLVLDFYENNFAEQVSGLDKNKKYLYYCRTGHRSGQASHYAEDLGFTNVYELKGGITAWKKAGYETVGNK